MAERREKLDIIKDILKAIQDKGGEIKPTHLLYKSNLSHEGMKKYVGDLIFKEMINEKTDKKSNKTFQITDKGLLFLANYKQIKEFTDSFGL
ncbi:MAG: winged helix-turn-helix domain-containing protein [archaeon]